MRNDDRTKPIPLLLIAISSLVQLGLLLFFIGFVLSQPKRKAAEERFFSTPADEVEKIVLRRHLRTRASPRMQTPVVLTDKPEIAEFLAVVHRSTEGRFQHASGEWSCLIEIVTANGSSFGSIDDTNQGGRLRLHSGQNDGWNFGAYRNDDLVDLLKRLDSLGPHAPTLRGPIPKVYSYVVLAKFAVFALAVLVCVGLNARRIRQYQTRLPAASVSKIF